GLEGDLNDAKVGRIIDEYMMSSLKESKWYNALDGGVNGLERNVRN
ncbi:MAG: TPM domain-containing protein, partial [Candidatus Colwellbacteria bacterium]|nr:TPM domain-containing protein [Candidatus Colwellbacteria bacterium]